MRVRSAPQAQKSVSVARKALSWLRGAEEAPFTTTRQRAVPGDDGTPFARAVLSWSRTHVLARRRNGGGHAHAQRICPTLASRSSARALHAGMRAVTGSTGGERAATHRGRSSAGAAHTSVEAIGRHG